ncbi:MAG: phage holin family protein [Bacillota bacterium]|nr:phage holin family protein [Bacillota bacterium]
MRTSFLWRVVLNAVSLYVVAEYLVAGITVQGTPALLIAALVLGIVNAILRPVIIILSLPINILTLGLLTFVINGLMLLITARLVTGFSVDSFGTAVWGAILLGIISYVLNSLVKDRD